MTSTDSTLLSRPSVADVEQAIALAMRAPSLHDSRPWRFVLTADVLELWADRHRPGLADPDGRALLVPCGGALHLACLGLAAQGWRTMTERMPDPAEPDLLARVRFIGRRTADGRVLATAAAAERPRAERRPFGPGVVSAALLDTLCATVDDPGVYAHSVRRPDERLDLAVAVSWADGRQAGDRAFRSELARWVRPAAASADDGVPTTADPHLLAGRPRHTEAAVRDVETGAPGRRPLADGEPADSAAGPDAADQPAYLVVFSRGDGVTDRLRSGEAYARLSVKAERLGLATSPLTQPLDVPAVRARLKALMSWPDHPQVILRVGRPPVGVSVPPAARRPVGTVLTVLRPDVGY